jgi:uncharacterized protein (DUF2384 family)
MTTITPKELQGLEEGIDAEIRHVRRCRKLLKCVDSAVLEAGRDLFDDSPGLALWLCSPARALGGKVPLDAMRTEEGRKSVAHILHAVAHGVFL